MAPKLRRCAMDEVKSRWATLLPEHRQAFMSFEDPFLVERIKCALQALFEKQMVMSHLGLQLGDDPDPFASSTLFTTAFEFTWNISRSRSNPAVCLVDPASMPVMAMKLPFLQSVDFFQDLQCVMPDFLSLRSGRAPLPRARWKEIWAVEPSSVAGMEQSLVKLVEQALWNMMSKPACNLAIAEAPAEEQLCEPVPLEAWMLDDEKPKGSPEKKKKKAQRQRRAPASKPLETTLEEGLGSDTPATEDERTSELCAHEEGAAAAGSDAEGSEADESVCMGTFHVDGEGSDISRDPTASSTPAAGFGGTREKFAPKRLATPTSSRLAPPELVCYIWTQTAQFGQHQDREPAHGSGAEPMSPACTTPFSRGQWRGPDQPGTPSAGTKVVVRNTFVDIEDPDDEPRGRSARCSRSLSPVRRCPSQDDAWHDRWHLGHQSHWHG